MFLDKVQKDHSAYGCENERQIENKNSVRRAKIHKPMRLNAIESTDVDVM